MNILVIMTYDYETLYSLQYVINKNKRKVISYDFYSDYDDTGMEYYKLVIKGTFNMENIKLWKRYFDNYKNKNIIDFYVI